jgi:hypothetical protein
MATATDPGEEVVRQLSADVLRHVQRDPGPLLRSPLRRDIWGIALLVPTPVKPGEPVRRGWVAISPMGCAVLAARTRAYAYAKHLVPNLADLAHRLGLALRHANKGDQHLFDLGSEYGQAGRSVLLAVPGPENFPWMDLPTVTPIPAGAEQTVANGFADVWAQALTARGGAFDEPPLASGGVAPLQQGWAPPPGPQEAWIRSQVLSLMAMMLPPSDLDAGRAAVRQGLADRVAAEMARCHLMQRFAPLPEGSWIPAWLLDTDAVLDAGMRQAEAEIQAATQSRKTVRPVGVPVPSVRGVVVGVGRVVVNREGDAAPVAATPVLAYPSQAGSGTGTGSGTAPEASAEFRSNRRPAVDAAPEISVRRTRSGTGTHGGY